MLNCSMYVNIMCAIFFTNCNVMSDKIVGQFYASLLRSFELKHALTVRNILVRIFKSDIFKSINFQSCNFSASMTDRLVGRLAASRNYSQTAGVSTICQLRPLVAAGW